MLRALERVGFRVVSQEGSHVKLRKVAADKTYTVIVTVHSELARRTLMSILKQAGLSPDEFRELL